MKIVILLILGAGLVAAAAITIRLWPIDAAAQHVDPAQATPPSTPNFVLLTGDQAPAFPILQAELAATLARALIDEGGQRIAGDLAQGHATYLFRSRLFGFPDLVSITLTPEGPGTRVQIFSRSLMGHGDMGVNRARVDRLTRALAP